MFAKWVLAIACGIGLCAGSRDGFAQYYPYPTYANGYGSYGWGYGGYGLGYSLGYGYGLNYAGYGGYYSPYGWGYGYPYGYGMGGFGYGGYGYGLGGYGYGYPFGYGYGGYYPYGLGFGGLYSPYGIGYGYGYGGYGGFGYPWGFFFPSYFNYGQASYGNPIASQPVYANSDYVGRSPVFATPQLAATAPFSTSTPTTVDGGEIVLFSPSSNTGTVQYNLNGMIYTMKPGTVQKFSNDRSWVVEVNDGSGQVLKYALQTGTYKFKQSNATFGLYTSDDKPDAAAASASPPETVPPRPSEGTTVPAPSPNIP